MDKKLIIAIIVIAFVFLAAWAVSAFSEPVGSPPSSNVPAPINVGSATQNKMGDLESENFTVRDGLTLGGVKRTSWPEGGDGHCDWEGTRCHCREDGSSGANVSITIGMTCAEGSLTDVKIVDLQISSRSKHCRSTAYSGCTADLYSRN
jgi:hypothetical protein